MSDQKPPIAPQELEAMEKLLADVQSQIGPSAEFTARMQKRLERHHALMQERGQMEQVGTKRTAFSFLSTHVYSVLTAFAFVLFTGGLSTFAYTSDSVTNGNALYPIKRGLESIEKTFAGTPGAQAEYQMKLLSRRLAESRFLTLQGVVDEPTNQEVTLVVNDGIEAIQAVSEVDYRDQLLDRITTLLKDEEARIYSTAGIPAPVTPLAEDVPQTSDNSSTSTSSSGSRLVPLTDTSSSTSVRAETPSVSVENSARVQIQQAAPAVSPSPTMTDPAPISDDRRTMTKQRIQPQDDAQSEKRSRGNAAARDRSDSSEEDVAVPLHVRPGVLEALQRNSAHLKKIELRVTEARRRR